MHQHQHQHQHRHRDERGVALASPVVLLSIVAVAMAAVAFFFTPDETQSEREISNVAGSPVAGASPSAPQSPEPDDETEQPKKKKSPAPVERSATSVMVFNNSGITGLAGQVGGTISEAGWQVAGTDDWYGSVPATTVYFPPELQRAGKQLALDLGVDRVLPAVDSMGTDRLTVILTAPLA